LIGLTFCVPDCMYQAIWIAVPQI